MATLNILAASALSMALLAMPLAPYSGKHETLAVTQNQTVSQALQEALGHRSFVLLITGFFVCGFHVAFITAHMPAFLNDNGFGPKLGAWSIAIIGLCNVVGAFLSGIWSGRIQKRYLLVGIYIGRAFAITLFLILPMRLPSVLVFSAVMGFLWLATVPPTSGLVAVLFGTRYMALLYGIVFLVIKLAASAVSGWGGGFMTAAAAMMQSGGWGPPLACWRPLSIGP